MFSVAQAGMRAFWSKWHFIWDLKHGWEFIRQTRKERSSSYDLELDIHGFKRWHCHFLALWTWAFPSQFPRCEWGQERWLCVVIVRIQWDKCLVYLGAHWTLARRGRWQHGPGTTQGTMTSLAWVWVQWAWTIGGRWRTWWLKWDLTSLDSLIQC